MNNNITIERLINNIADHLSLRDPSKLTANTILRDIDGWSSLDALFLLLMVDDVYKVNISGDEITDSFTIKDLYDLILKSRE